MRWARVALGFSRIRLRPSASDYPHASGSIPQPQNSLQSPELLSAVRSFKFLSGLRRGAAHLPEPDHAPQQLISSPPCSPSHSALYLRAFSIRRGSVGPSGSHIPRRRRAKPSSGPPVDRKYVPAASTSATQQPSQVQLPERVSVRQLSILLGEKLSAIQEALGSLGEATQSPDSFLSADVAELVSLDFGKLAVRKERGLEVEGAEGEGEGGSGPWQWAPRAPVVTVMGHVDHGKTSLLDALRRTAVAASEAGGITQHIGAFQVAMPEGGARLTFLDTPGHAAFAAMRARGARATDVVVLVVAADDGVKAQTREALTQARAAGVPLLVALSKCDLRASDPGRVRTQLLAEGVALEEVGGEVQLVELSARTGQGLAELEEALLFQAELAGLRARLDGPARAVVLEARVDRGQGPLATVLVQAGQLALGDFVVVGCQWGRVRAMRDHLGKALPCAGPSEPVEVAGLKGVPEAGDELLCVASEERARQVAAARQRVAQVQRLQRMQAQAQAEASSSEPQGADGEPPPAGPREAVLVVKTDVHGTMQAICQALEGLTCPQVRVRVVHCGVGPPSQSDVALAEATGACALVAFNVGRTPAPLLAQAERARLKVLSHRVIYHLLEEVAELLVGLAAGTTVVEVAGQASVLQVFPLKLRGRVKRSQEGSDSVLSSAVAGCRVVQGSLQRGQQVRVVRMGRALFEGRCQSLRQEKKEVESVGQGEECGLTLEGFGAFLTGDSVEALKEAVRKPRLVSSRETGEMRIVD